MMAATVNAIAAARVMEKSVSHIFGIP